MKIAIIGVGNMGRAVLAGLLQAGHEPADVHVGTRRPEHGRQLQERYGVTPASNRDAVAAAEVVILGVKPYDIVNVLTEVGGSLRDQLVISLAAGITTATMEAVVPAGVEVVRVMPNTPALVGEGASAIAGGARTSEERLALAQELMQATGVVVRLPERLIDAAAAISGSGPAYVFYIAEAMIEAGVHLGLPRPVAATLVTQTLVGSAQMLRDTGEHPAVLREQVTSPGGTTAAALRELEAHRLRAAFLDATRANLRRSQEIAREG